MNEEKILESIDKWLNDIAESNQDDFEITMDSFKDLYQLTTEIEKYLAENSVSRRTKKVAKRFIKQVKELQELTMFNQLIDEKKGTLKNYLATVDDREKEQFEEIIGNFLRSDYTIADMIDDYWYRFCESFVYKKEEKKEEISDKEKKKIEEKVDSYNYKFYRATERFMRKERQDISYADLEEYSKKISKLENKYEQVLNGRKPNEVFDDFSNTTAKVVKDNNESLDTLLKYDNNGYLDIKSYVQFLEASKKDEAITEQEYQETTATFDNLVNRCKTVLYALNLDAERKAQMQNNYKKYRNKIVIKLGLVALTGILGLNSLNSCGKNNNSQEEIEIETTYETEENIFGEEELENNPELEKNPEKEEVNEESKTEIEKQEEIKEEKEELEYQKSILENLKETLNVSSEEEEKYADIISIGDIVTLNSNSAKVYTDIYSMNSEVNGKNAYFDMSEERLVQSLVMAKDGVVKNVCDMESYEELVSEGYTLSGVSTLNQYSQNGEIEGRFQADSLVLKK